MCKRENWALMQHAVVVWLHGNPSVLAHRTVADGTSTRPLLSTSDNVGDLAVTLLLASKATAGLLVIHMCKHMLCLESRRCPFHF